MNTLQFGGKWRKINLEACKRLCLIVLKITKPKLAVNEKYGDVLACDDEINELVVRGMLGSVQAFAWCNGLKKVELIVHRKLMQMVTNIKLVAMVVESSWGMQAMVHGAQQKHEPWTEREYWRTCKNVGQSWSFHLFFFQPNSVKGDSGARNTVTWYGRCLFIKGKSRT